MPLFIILIGWLVALAIFFGFIVFLRYLQYREHIALISHGVHPGSVERRRRGAGMLRAGLITAMVGLSLTVGLYPIGFILPPQFGNIPFHLGPWLLPGLIPLGVGVALVASYYLEHDPIYVTFKEKQRLPLVKESFEENDEDPQ